MRLIVTGGAGFIGSAAVRRAVGAGHDVLTIDKLTYAGRRAALREVMNSRRHQFLQADIAHGDAMESAFREFDPDAVLHLAAESHVDRSIDDPGAFIETNVRGTFVLLETALRHWSQLRGARQNGFRFVHVSTDEVFGTVAEEGPFDVNSRYAPNSPYAASKAAADHLARAWHRTYGMPALEVVDRNAHICFFSMSETNYKHARTRSSLKDWIDFALGPLRGNGIINLISPHTTSSPSQPPDLYLAAFAASM